MKIFSSLLLLFTILPAGFSIGQDILPFEPDDTLEEIRYKIDHNGYSFEVADNWVFDMSREEKSRFFSRRASAFTRTLTAETGLGPLGSRLGTIALPETFDWRDHNGHTYIGDIRNQGGCGSCYAFGACAAAEGTYNWATGNFDDNCADFSESYIIWCLGRLPAYSSDFFGCDGASYAYMELEALTVEGIANESDFPYQENDPGSCTHWSDQTTVFQSWHRVPCNNIEAIKTAIMTYGVVDAAVDVGSAFEGYAHGIYEDSNTACNGTPCDYTTTNHAISLVGWDDSPPEGGGGVWILRNSWGDSWGESGYMRIRYTSAATSCAVCYLVYQPPTTPTPTPIGYFTPTPTPSITPTPAGFRTASPSPTPTASSTPAPYSIPFSEGFEEAWSDGAPKGWTKEYIMGSNDWTQADGGYYGYPDSAHSGSYNARFFYDDWDDIVTRLISPRMEFGPYIYNPRLTFWLAMEVWDEDQDELSIYYRTSLEGSWNLLTHYESSLPTWTEQVVDLPEPGDDYYICFQGTANYGYGICVDDLLITGDAISPTPTPILPPPATTTPSPPPSATPRPSTIPSPVPTATPSPSTTPTPVPTATPRPSTIPTPVPTATPSPSTTPTPVLTPTPEPTASTHGPTPSPTPEGGGGPHMVVGRLFNSDHSIPADEDISFKAFITLRPAEFMTETAKSCGYDNGYWQVNVGNFPTDWKVGEDLRVGFNNMTNAEAGILLYSLTYDDPDLAPDFYLSPTTSPTPSVTPITPTPIATATPLPTSTITRCFRVAGKVVDQDTGEPLSGAAVRIVCPDGRSGVEDANGSGEYDLSICTHFEDGTVRAQARYRGYLPGYADARYIDWADEGVVDMGDIELKTDSIYSGGIVSGDYDGDGLSDIAIFRPASGLWAIRGISRLYFGGEGDEMIPADYDGDGTADVSIFRPSYGLWAIRGLSRIYYGAFSDIPVPGDYGGDGTSMIGIFRGASGLWSIRYVTRTYFGGRYDQPVSGDYDGDGSLDTAIFRSSSGLWAMRGISRFYFGDGGDSLVPGDYDGLGYRTAGIFRQSSGLWAIKGVTRVYYGGSGDQPVPGDYSGSGGDDIGIFRRSSGLWAVRGATRVYFGSDGDIPVTR